MHCNLNLIFVILLYTIREITKYQWYKRCPKIMNYLLKDKLVLYFHFHAVFQDKRKNSQNYLQSIPHFRRLNEPIWSFRSTDNAFLVNDLTTCGYLKFPSLRACLLISKRIQFHIASCIYLLEMLMMLGESKK